MTERATLAAPPPPGKRKRRAKKRKKPAWAAVEGTPAAKKIPDGYHTLTMSMTVTDAAKAIDFYTAVFGATERSRMPSPDGRLMHAELQFGDSVLMLADEFPEMGNTSATTLGGSPVMVHHYVTNVDETHAKAVEGGGQPILPVTDMFWGDRYGAVVDPVGFPWGVASRTEIVTPEQMAERIQAAMAEGAPGQETPEGEAPAAAEEASPAT
ncbi:MAG: VOC family protein [Deltaproteobacteria bacterium]|nr:VOC family protein [Deltaproteobacteria bacterium]